MKSIKTKLSTTLLCGIVLILIVSGCGSDEKESSKSMQQIQSDEGIPVNVEAIQQKPFKKYLSFFSKLRGYKESTIGAAIGGRIEKINFKVGDYVKKDDVIIQFPLDSPGSMYEQALSAYENSRKNFERAEALLKSGEMSQAAYDGLETKYLVDKSNYDTQRQMLFLEAPYDGVITEIKVNEGDNVKSKDPLFSIAQLNKMTTKVLISSDELAQIKKGADAVAEFNGKEFSGKVTEVSLSADPMTQSFYAELEFPNPGNQLKSGVTINIKVLTYENPQAIIIPRNLVKEDAEGMYVFIEKNSAAEKKYITNGSESGLNYEIKSGLMPGDKLIIKGASQLENGTKVKVIQ